MTKLKRERKSRSKHHNSTMFYHQNFSTRNTEQVDPDTLPARRYGYISKYHAL